MLLSWATQKSWKIQHSGQLLSESSVSAKGSVHLRPTSFEVGPATSTRRLGTSWPESMLNHTRNATGSTSPLSTLSRLEHLPGSRRATPISSSPPPGPVTNSAARATIAAVSYTHLTLPTIYS